jgi:hypothetical protein
MDKAVRSGPQDYHLERHGHFAPPLSSLLLHLFEMRQRSLFFAFSLIRESLESTPHFAPSDRTI